MTPLLSQPPSSPPRAHLLRLMREIQGKDFIRFTSSKFELVRVGKRLRPYGEPLARAMAEAGINNEERP